MGGRGEWREREKERIMSKLHAIPVEPDARLKPMNPRS